MQKSAVAASYDAITKKQEGGAEAGDRPKPVPFRSFNNFVKKRLVTDVIAHFAAPRDAAAPRGGGRGGRGGRGGGRGAAAAAPTAPVRDLSVLDLASGRGGDIQKWLYTNRIGRGAGMLPVIGALNGYDISPECVAAARQRFDAIVAQSDLPHGDVTFDVADCFGEAFWTSLATERAARYDIVASFFALHYGCRSVESLRIVLRGVAAVLKSGGIFFGTIVDAEELTRRLCTRPRDDPTVKNDLFDIQVTHAADQERVAAAAEALAARNSGSTDAPIPDDAVLPIGLNYYFNLVDHVDCDEFVIPFHTLVHEAQQAGLVLAERHSYPFVRARIDWLGDKSKLKDFGDEGDMDATEKALVSLYRTFAFERRQT